MANPYLLQLRNRFFSWVLCHSSENSNRQKQKFVFILTPFYIALLQQRPKTKWIPPNSKTGRVLSIICLYLPCFPCIRVVVIDASKQTLQLGRDKNDGDGDRDGGQRRSWLTSQQVAAWELSILFISIWLILALVMI